MSHERYIEADEHREPCPSLLSGSPGSGAEWTVAPPPDQAAGRRANAERGGGKTPPARQWIDDEKDYTKNENAINWNAPLVFILSEASPHPRPHHRTSASSRSTGRSSVMRRAPYSLT